jgi:hypothetical protein
MESTHRALCSKDRFVFQVKVFTEKALLLNIAENPCSN